MSDQGILKREVSLYHWPPVWLVWNQLYDNWQFLFLFAKQTNPNQSNRRSVVQWYFPPLVFPEQTISKKNTLAYFVLTLATEEKKFSTAVSRASWLPSSATSHRSQSLLAPNQDSSLPGLSSSTTRPHFPPTRRELRPPDQRNSLPQPLPR